MDAIGNGRSQRQLHCRSTKAAAASRSGEGVTVPGAPANCSLRPRHSSGRDKREQTMPSFAFKNIFFAATISIAALAAQAAPALADDAMKTETMSSEPMKADPMATNTMAAEPMAADPMKADCLNKAEAETDAAKKETMMAECDAMAGGAMKSDQMAPQQ